MKSLEQLREDLKAMEAELAAKERRIAELEAIESIEPVLDPSRVLATAVLYFRDYAPDYDAAWDIQARMPKAAKPYRLKWAAKREHDKECREIVRRLVEWAADDNGDVVKFLELSDEAAKLWAEMKGAGDES